MPNINGKQSHLVQVSGKSSEFQQFVLLQALREVDIVEVVEAVYRVSESLEVFLLDQEIIVRLIDSLNIELKKLGQLCTCIFIDSLTCWTAMRYGLIKGTLSLLWNMRTTRV